MARLILVRILDVFEPDTHIEDVIANCRAGVREAFLDKQAEHSLSQGIIQKMRESAIRDLTEPESARKMADDDVLCPHGAPMIAVDRWRQSPAMQTNDPRERLSINSRLANQF